MLGIATTDPRTEIRDINGDLIEGAAFNVVKNISNGLSEGFVEFSIDVTSHEKASAAIKVFDTAIERVNGERASLGALQNRLEHTINNLKVTHENLSSSESRIRDADMALEMTAFTKNNILNQSAQAMLAQANQLPQGVLQLLQG
ncbi:flagellin [Bacillus sp. FJAT-29937]|uniref:flagellin n=1 Tax=Bacillus sp. FJAT-29937 TaxID=1720553 RepID=UPI003FA486FA